MADDPETIEVGKWTARVRVPEGPGPHPLLLLLHGWTGDENVMWIFASRLPQHYLMAAPRGFYTTPLGGFGWHPHHKGWPQVGEFEPAVTEVLDLVEQLQQTLQVDFKADEAGVELNLVGFSQGAALANVIALKHPERVHRLAGLAGFVPEGAEELAAARPLEGKRVFAAHGTQDELVDIARARRSVEILEQAGAQVIYCEDDVGHKLSLHCFRGLESYFEVT